MTCGSTPALLHRGATSHQRDVGSRGAASPPSHMALAISDGSPSQVAPHPIQACPPAKGHDGGFRQSCCVGHACAPDPQGVGSEPSSAHFPSEGLPRPQGGVLYGRHKTSATVRRLPQPLWNSGAPPMPSWPPRS